MLKIGIIGCGNIAQVRHIPEYQANPYCELAAFYNHGREKAELMAQQYGGICCNNIEELLNTRLDAVSICTSNNSHAELAIRALEAGCHVLCEKPMAVTMDECRDMVEAAKKNHRKLMIANNQRFTSVHQEAKELIRSGVVGKILSFETKFIHRGPDMWTGSSNPWFYDKRKAGMGALGDLGVHKIDVLHHILGEPIVAVQAVLKTLDKRYPDGSLIDVEDNAWCIMETASGITGSLYAGWTCYADERNSLVIYGTGGILRCYDDPQYALVIERGEDIGYCDLGAMQNNDDQKAGFVENTGVINEFVDSIMEDREPVSSGKDGLSTMQVLFAALESGKSGKKVEIKSMEV